VSEIVFWQAPLPLIVASRSTSLKTITFLFGGPVKSGLREGGNQPLRVAELLSDRENRG